MKQKILLLVTLFILSIANSQEVDGVNYQITSSSPNLVSVIAKIPKYVGGVTIPLTVIIGTETYTVISIGNMAFEDCVNLNYVSIPITVTSIGNYAFNNCTALGAIILPNALESIGLFAFQNCTILPSIDIPNSVTSISSSAFQFCTGLTTVSYPNASMASYVFRECTGLTSINIPNSVTSIRYGTFFGCTGLTSINIPNSVTSIENEAFNGCTGLTSVSVNIATPININPNVFAGVTISNIPLYVPEGSENTYNTAAVWQDFASIQSQVFFNDGILQYVITDAINNYVSASRLNNSCPTGTLTIPNTVINTATGITYTVNSIEESAFWSCTSLMSVVIPSTVTNIGVAAFNNCTNLMSINMPSSITNIGAAAFNNCTSLTSINIPSSVTGIANSFANCTGLTSVRVNWATPLIIDNTNNNMFLNVDIGSIPLTVPFGSGTLYQNAELWQDFGSIVLSTEDVRDTINVQLFPNPVHDKLYINLGFGFSIEKVSIYNNLGQLIQQTTASIIDMSNLKGLYFVHINTNKGNATKKIIVE